MTRISRLRLKSFTTSVGRWAVTTVLLMGVCSAPPANAAAQVSVVDTSRTAWTFFNPVSVNDWRGVVNVREEAVTDARSTLNKHSAVSFNLWKRACDVTGCLESVMSTINTPATTSSWSDSLSQARISVAAGPVRMQRYRVGAAELTLIDDVVVLVPIAVSLNRVATQFSQTSTARGSGVLTTSRMLRVTAQTTVEIASLRMESDQGSMTSSSNLTTTAVKTRR